MEECQKIYLGISIDMACVLDNSGGGSCQGDSGSPYVYENAGSLKLVGVVLGGSGCGVFSQSKNLVNTIKRIDMIDLYSVVGLGYPKVFTSVPFFHNWIQATMQSNSGSLFLYQYLQK